MGHPDLRSECDINTLDPLLHQDVVDDLLSKYVKTFTVSGARTHTHTNTHPLTGLCAAVQHHRVVAQGPGDGQEGLAEGDGARGRPGRLLPDHPASHRLPGAVQRHTCTHSILERFNNVQ